jgi:hypothetical protein
MTSGIADRKEYRLIFGFGLLEGFITPRIPIHRIFGVLF